MSAQKKVIYQANTQIYDENFDPDIQRLIGNVIFQHEDVKIYCDSAYYWDSKQLIQGYGKNLIVHINDTTTLYGKEIQYNGFTKMATIKNNVRLVQKNITLYTDSLTYNIIDDIAYYDCGGKIQDEANLLTSQKAYFYTQIDEVYFKDSVVLLNEDYTIYSDTMMFNTVSKIVYIFGPTNIISDENTIFATKGWYNTEKDDSKFYDRAVFSTPPQILIGDDVYYNRYSKFGTATGNVEIIDTSQNLIALGEYVEYDELDGYAMITDSTVLIYIDEEDSLFLHCDTVRILMDSLKQVKEIHAFNQVAFYRSDIQGRCDSMVYILKDSILTMYNQPILWGDSAQITADTIAFFIPENRNIIGYFNRNAIFISSLYSQTEFNQVKGKTMTAYFNNMNLYHIDVTDNVKTIYYLQDADSALIGINITLSSSVAVNIENNEIKTIQYIQKPEGTVYPYASIPQDEKKLQNFNWQYSIRPKSKNDIFIHRSDKL